jgi:hypothetical protein
MYSSSCSTRSARSASLTVDDILELLLPPPGLRFGLFAGS